MPGFDEVNFWTRTPWGVRGLEPGDRFYFMLKHPIRKIGGFGLFVRYEDTQASVAWARYGEANSVRSLHELVGRTRHYAGRHSTYFDVGETDPTIGNIILSNAEFFDEKDYFTATEAGQPGREVAAVDAIAVVDQAEHETMLREIVRLAWRRLPLGNKLSFGLGEPNSTTAP